MGIIISILYKILHIKSILCEKSVFDFKIGVFT